LVLGFRFRFLLLLFYFAFALVAACRQDRTSLNQAASNFQYPRQRSRKEEALNTTFIAAPVPRSMTNLSGICPPPTHARLSKPCQPKGFKLSAFLALRLSRLNIP
jgi:hypothetical protein